MLQLCFITNSSSSSRRCRSSSISAAVVHLLLLLFVLPAVSDAFSSRTTVQQHPLQQDTLLYKRSERQCSAGNFCREEDFFHYYGCSFGICDFHLQPWLYVLIAFIVLCFLLSVLISLINCVCCRD
ncbi:hypothetical protein niasHS_018212 [Heterodera schachtii]|uniref:Uncharacterized protein n=1 Tax=Heterodera schachtii TaxID=97005 RepID=A0ABD2HQA1_HETSC